jgi:xanthine dehydrogenase accessory factor
MSGAVSLSPLEGEMAAKRPEGVGSAMLDVLFASRSAAATPPDRFAATLPSRGRG